MFGSRVKLFVVSEASEAVLTEKVNQYRESVRVWFRDRRNVADRAAFLIPVTPG